MKKTLYLLTALLLFTFTVFAFADFGKNPKISYNILYSSILDSDDFLLDVDEDNPELNSYVANPEEYDEEIHKDSVLKEENIVVKKSKKVARTLAVSDTENVPDDVQMKDDDDVCYMPYLGDDPYIYDAQIITVRKKFKFDLDEYFKVKVYVKNTGNVPWFSPDSKCSGTRVYLGTTRNDGHFSPFYLENDKSYTGWVTRNKIRLDKGNNRIDPGEIASFTFYSKADSENSIFREFFAPQLDDGTFLRNAEFKIDIYSGEHDENDPEVRSKLSYAYKSMNLNEINADGAKSIEVNLSEQKMLLKIDNYVIREFKVSTGKYSTPTPRGTFKITEKNDVRVGVAAPHYIMPHFQRLTSSGIGLHALPSLSNDGGVFWTEAKDHIGTPVSHGCIRMLPEDARFAFEFTDIGDPVTVYW